MRKRPKKWALSLVLKIMHTIGLGIFKLFILVFIGYLSYRGKLLTDEITEAISKLLIYVFLPALIFTKTIQKFDPSIFPGWWFLPICAIWLAILGIVIGYLVKILFPDFKSPREFIMGCGFQNSGYLPMAIVIFAFSGAFADKLLIFIFLYLLGFNLIFWSFVPLYLKGKLKSHFRILSLFTPPVIAMIFSLLWAWIFGKESLPKVVYEPLNLLGQATFPLSMLVLGAFMARYKSHKIDSLFPLAAGVVIKLVIIPAIALLLVFKSPLFTDYKFFILLEAAMPAATSLVIVGAYVKADNRFLSSLIFYTHLFSIVTIPIWLYIFNIIMA